jgi:methionyl aminopeptidase
VKIDVGAHLDGAISDTATTVEVGGEHKFERLIRASRDGLEAGIAQVRPGVSVDEIGRAVARAIRALGFKPVENLTGHTIERYLLHGGISVPNVGGLSDLRLEEGQVLAIEPFATNGAGAIENGAFGNIVRFRTDPGARDPEVAKLYGRFQTLPFTARWLDERERGVLRAARRSLQVYPVFIEQARGTVAQSEHTLLVGPTGAEVLTRGRATE